MGSLRRWVQTVATFLSNAYWLFSFNRNIYQGNLKSICVPGLNCYSCPAATGACPLGALQHFMASLRPAIKAGQPHFGMDGSEPPAILPGGLSLGGDLFTL